MNWIKEHRFIVVLAAITLAGALVLWVLGSGAAKRYEEAKSEFDFSVGEASRFEKLEPYPTAENLESKKRALEAYQEQVGELKKAFSSYAPESLERITVQAFSDAVKRASEETRAAFGKDVAVPEEYYCGFELYRNTLPPGNATTLLNYQLKAIRAMMLRLAESGVSQLVNVHRPNLPEEDGKTFEPGPGEVARSLPFEVVFEGRESAVRQFLNTLVNDKEHYYVVRSLCIKNKKLLPPRTTDAKFERPAAGPLRPAAGAADNVDFNALFGGAPPAEAPAEAPAPEVAPPPAAADSSRILAQVLGQEELQVFVRIDVLLFMTPEN